MRYWGLTDPGCIRPQNQDTYRIEALDKHTVLCVVCDGMGGAKSGDVASALAVETFTHKVKAGYHSDIDEAEVEKMLRDAVDAANFAVHDKANQFEEYAGMGTTLVAALVQSKRATFVNVGDSRGYYIAPEGIRQITRDHSLVQMMVYRGELTPEQAKSYPGKNFITRAIGTESAVECDLNSVSIKKGNYILLCTDGLSNLLDEQELLYEVAHEGETELCCQRLLEIAKKRGAPDNVTSALVAI